MEYIVAVIFILKLVLCSTPISPHVAASPSLGSTVVSSDPT